MKRSTFVLLLCLILGDGILGYGTPTAIADSGSGQKTISPEAVLAGLKQAEEKVQNFSVKIHWTKFFKFGLPQLDEPVKTQADTTYVTDGPQRIAYEYTSEGFSVGPDKKTSIYPRRGKMAFDGKLCRILEAPRQIEAWHGQIYSYASWYAGPDPREFTTNYFQEPITNALKARGIVVAGQTEWDGHHLTIVETAQPVQRSGHERRKMSFWIDPARNWLVVRRAILVQYRPEQKWQEYHYTETRGHQEVSPGIWLPRKLKLESLQVTEKQQPATLAWREEGEARDWQVNRKLSPTQFVLDFSPGTPVDDYTVTPQRSYIVPESKAQADAKQQKAKRPPIYDEKADAKAEIADALKKARIEDKRVLITWGGNWCGWCYKLHDVFEEDRDCAKIILNEFVVVLVDINPNTKLYDHYVPKKEQGGFPFLTLLKKANPQKPTSDRPWLQIGFFSMIGTK